MIDYSLQKKKDRLYIYFIFWLEINHDYKCLYCFQFIIIEGKMLRNDTTLISSVKM